MAPNIITVLLAGLVPMVIGFVWYGPLFSKLWMKEARMTQEMIEGGNMPVIFGLAYVFSVLAAFMLFAVTVHQTDGYSLLITPGSGEMSAADKTQFEALIATYGDRYRHFGHGAFHGGIAGVFLVFPALATNALFERKSWKYIGINAGYWIISFALMGGVVCQWG